MSDREVRIGRASVRFAGHPVDPTVARTVVARALALAASDATAADGAGLGTGRIADLRVEVRVVHTDEAGLADAIGRAVGAAVRREWGR